MLKVLFVPELLGSHRFIAQRILGIAIHEDAVRMALVYAKRNKTVVEQLVTVPLSPLEPGSTETHKDRIIAALAAGLAQVKNYHQIRVAMSSSIVVFKELTLQFVDIEKIRMVLEYEIEPMLPFSVDEAIIDFIVSKSDTKENCSQILVAAVRKQEVADFLELLSKAGIDPTCITVDLLAQYGIFSTITAQQVQQRPVALVDFGLQSTRISFICDGELRLTRHVPKGISTLCKQIIDETKAAESDLELKLAQLGIDGLGDEALIRSAHKHFALLVNDIQFTLNSFSMKLAINEEIGRVLVTGCTDRVKGLIDFCSTTMQVACVLFEPQKIFGNKALKNALLEEPSNWTTFTFALGTAIANPSQYYFDLRRKEFTSHRQGLVKKQIIVAACITLFLFMLVGIKGYLEITDLSTQINTIEQREVNRFKNEQIFPKDKFPKKPTLANVIREGERIVKDKLDLWAPFAKNRINVLEIWLELTSIINKKQFDVKIKELSITTKENGKLKVEIDGLFKSKTGEHFGDWAGLEGRFKESSLLKIPDADQADATPAPEGGVNFNIRMSLREE
jgi:type IV pilus assembly protein PilM